MHSQYLNNFAKHSFEERKEFIPRTVLEIPKPTRNQFVPKAGSDSIQSYIKGTAFKNLKSPSPKSEDISYQSTHSPPKEDLTPPSEKVKYNLEQNAMAPLQSHDFNIYMNISIYMNTKPPIEESFPKEDEICSEPINNFSKSSDTYMFKIQASENQKLINEKPGKQINGRFLNLHEKEVDKKIDLQNIPGMSNKSSNLRKKCKCSRKLTIEEQQRYCKLINKRIHKIQNFWTRKSKSYPFSFRKKIINYYTDTNEISIKEVLDFSHKLLDIKDSEVNSVFEHN